MKTIIKQTLRKLFRHAGLELRRYNPAVSDSARLRHLLKYHGINLVLDVGANIGQYAKHLREIGYSGRIVSFEPLPAAHSQLLNDSKRDGLWEIAPRMAIGNRDGQIEIHVARNSFSSSALPILDSHLKAAPASEYVDSIMVDLSRLDTVAPKYLNDRSSSIFLKVDVQGFEHQVLEGASQILPRLKGIQLEISLVPLYQGETLFRDMLDRLDDLGYELYALSPSFTDMTSGRTLQCDGVFFRK